MNIGGWLLLNRMVTPYLFALTTCHIQGDFCFYPGQIDAPPSGYDYDDTSNICNLNHCTPHLIDSPFSSTSSSSSSRANNRNSNNNNKNQDKHYPYNDYTLLQSFPSTTLRHEYLHTHWDHFITIEDVEQLHDAGVTHVRVPIPYWILGNDYDNTNPNNGNSKNFKKIILENEPFVDGGWLYFIRFVNWCSKYNIQVWIDLASVPILDTSTSTTSSNGNGNGNGNTEHYTFPTCHAWSNNRDNVERTLYIVERLATAIVRDGLNHTVTGFGLLNVPYFFYFDDDNKNKEDTFSCNIDVVKEYYNQAYSVVRERLGKDISISISDLYNARYWNQQHWWRKDDDTGTTTTSKGKYSNTYLDSSYAFTHVMSQQARDLSPKQHIAYVCGKNYREVTSCCYNDEDDESNKNNNNGISHIASEWNAGYDINPISKMVEVMDSIKNNGGQVVDYSRTLSKERQEFLSNFVKAQMVIYETTATSSTTTETSSSSSSVSSSSPSSVSRGWFYSNIKMEGGAFAEWDFLRGIKEGWIPKLLPNNANVASEEIYGTCHRIAASTKDDMSIIQPYPLPDNSRSNNNNNNGKSSSGTTSEHDWFDEVIDDDYVLSHAASQKSSSSSSSKGSATATTKAQSSSNTGGSSSSSSGTSTNDATVDGSNGKSRGGLFPLTFIGFFCYGVYQVFFRQDAVMPIRNRFERFQYSEVSSAPNMLMV